MGTGPSGQNGENVLQLVAADSTLAQESAPLRNMAGKTALENPTRLVPVIRSLVQVQ